MDRKPLDHPWSERGPEGLKNIGPGGNGLELSCPREEHWNQLGDTLPADAPHPKLTSFTVWGERQVDSDPAGKNSSGQAGGLNPTVSPPQISISPALSQLSGNKNNN